MPDPVLQTIPLGFQWATVDPFLFCVHHLDLYPEANEHMGPAASLEARDIGMDFAGADGWRMYHGSTVPGFPQHPHRGFETVTFVRQGFIDHSDSLGATARFGRGDVQWLTAGQASCTARCSRCSTTTGRTRASCSRSGSTCRPGDKMVEPYFTMLWNNDIPTHHHVDDAGVATEITVIAGSYGDLQLPPSSHRRTRGHRAPRPTSRFKYIVGELERQDHCRRTAKGADNRALLYVFEGSVHVGDRRCGVDRRVFRSDRSTTMTAGPLVPRSSCCRDDRSANRSRNTDRS